MHAIFDTFSWGTLLQITLLDILLGGDNAVVIALAAKKLPPDMRWRAMGVGVIGAISLRIVLLYFAVSLLNIPGLKLIGAAFLVWIGIKLMNDADNDSNVDSAVSFFSAVRTIIIADAIMSLDNVFAVAGAAKGSVVMAVLGVLLSIPIILLGSHVIIKVMAKYPSLVAAGAGLLGWVAGNMALSDIFIKGWTDLISPVWTLVICSLSALLVISLGFILHNRSAHLRAEDKSP